MKNQLICSIWHNDSNETNSIVYYVLFISIHHFLVSILHVTLANNSQILYSLKYSHLIYAMHISLRFFSPVRTILLWFDCVIMVIDLFAKLHGQFCCCCFCKHFFFSFSFCPLTAPHYNTFLQWRSQIKSIQ